MDQVGSLTSGPNTSPLTGAVDTSAARADEFYRRLAQLQQQYQQQLSQQNQLGSHLDQVIAGTAPSVAGTQLQQGVGQARDAISAQAAGASGNNAGVANYGALQALAQAHAKANQDAAVLRAQEVAQATAAKGQLLNQEQAANDAQTSTATGAGTALSGQSLQGAGQLGTLNANEINARRALLANLANGVGSAAIKAAA